MNTVIIMGARKRSSFTLLQKRHNFFRSFRVQLNFIEKSIKKVLDVADKLIQLTATHEFKQNEAYLGVISQLLLASGSDRLPFH